MISSLLHALLEPARRFRRDRRGNVAMTFGLALVPMVTLVGMAIDYTRASSIKTTLQSALDATALAMSKTATSTSATTLQTNAQTYFSSIFSVDGVTTPTITATYNPASTTNATVVVSGSAAVTTSFLGLAGIKTVNVSGSSTTTWGMTRLRVALALDNTGSMDSSGKLTALKTATNNLLSQLKAAAVNNGDVYVSIVPFAKVVNVGTSSNAGTWIDWTDWEAAPANSTPSSSVGPGSSCPYGTRVRPYGYACTATPLNGSSTVSNIPSSGTYAGYINPGPDSGTYNNVATYRNYNGGYNSVGTQTCTTVYGNKTCSTSYAHTWVPNSHTTWDGSIMDRAQDYDTKNTSPTSTATKFPAAQATSIDATPVAMLPMTYDWTALSNEVANMDAGGGTNQAIGLAWAWQSLSAGAPMNAPPEDPVYNYTHVILLLSDGLNTEDRWYGDGTTYSAQVDARQKILCDNIKASGTTIYAVQVNTDGSDTASVMQYCASDASKFVMLTNANQIITTFQQIGATLSALRISK